MSPSRTRTVPEEVLTVLCRACDINGWLLSARCRHQGLDLTYVAKAWRRLADIARNPTGGAS